MSNTSAKRPIIAIGHPSYGDWCFNHRTYHSSKSSAVRELMSRFVPRQRARKAVEVALQNGYGSFTHTEAPSGAEYGIELVICQ